MSGLDLSADRSVRPACHLLAGRPPFSSHPRRIALPAGRRVQWLKRFLAALAIMYSIFLGGTSAYAQWWNPFAPKDYEDCSESAARDARSKEALSVLLASCESKFPGRRKPGGGYTFYDPRQLRAFDISGPSPTSQEMAYIDHQYSIYLANLAEGQRRADEAERQAAAQAAEAQRQADQRAAEARQQAEEAERQAALERENEKVEFQQRQQTARHMLAISSTNIECKLMFTCGLFSMTVTIVNRSRETLSVVDFGWAFLPAQDSLCPTSYESKRTVRSPGSR
jgi:hypothetical protein